MVVRSEENAEQENHSQGVEPRHNQAALSKHGMGRGVRESCQYLPGRISELTLSNDYFLLLILQVFKWQYCCGYSVLGSVLYFGL